MATQFNYLSYYNKGANLGAGAFGSVVQYTLNRAGSSNLPNKLAVKFFQSISHQEAEYIRRELGFMALEHRHIVKFYGYVQSPELGIVMELAAGTLTKVLRSLKGKNLAYVIGDQILSALEYVHARNIIHRDIKPDNILVAKTLYNGLPKFLLSDFGIARQGSGSTALGGHYMYYKTGAGTEIYMAPEVKTGHYTNKVDIFSIGVVMLETYLGYHVKPDVGYADVNRPPYKAIQDLSFRNMMVVIFGPSSSSLRPDARSLRGTQFFQNMGRMLTQADKANLTAHVKQYMAIN